MDLVEILHRHLGICLGEVAVDLLALTVVTEVFDAKVRAVAMRVVLVKPPCFVDKLSLLSLDDSAVSHAPGDSVDNNPFPNNLSVAEFESSLFSELVFVESSPCPMFKFPSEMPFLLDNLFFNVIFDL